MSSTATVSSVPQQVPSNYFKTYNNKTPLINPDSVFNFFNWQNTSSTLTDKPFVGRVPPPSKSPFSLFIDRKFTRIPDKAIHDYFRNDLRGVIFFPEDRFLQLTFHDEVSFQKHLKSSPITLNDKTVHLSPPRDFPRQTLVIHLHSLPILEKETIRTSITETLSQYCNIKQVAPVVITDTNILTTKWDAIVEPIANKNIPVHLHILGCSIALTWANSSQICLRCHHTDHTHHNCPTKPTIIRPNPARTFAQVAQSSNHLPNPVSYPQKDANTNRNSDTDSINPTQITHTLSNTNTNTTSSSTNNSSYSNLVIINETDSITEHALQEEQMLTAEEDNDSDNSSSSSDMAIDMQHKDDNKNTNSTDSSSLSLSIHAPHGTSPQSDKNNQNVENNNHPYKPAKRHSRRSTKKSTN